ncbi:unnamed protein product [Fusarium graminearum]|uniref:Xylanolytic transcriptional activator regulatory domain-containing protein n=1 Tax=Gibberella zeae TaxID=5518 RepID=A0A9N8RR12_GIBZA|nr:unnamed protein product [Fusarium graminearum]
MENEFLPYGCSNETPTPPAPGINSPPATQPGDRLQQLELALRIIADISSSSLADPASSWNPTPEPGAQNQALNNVPNPFVLEVAERMPDNVSLPSLLAATRRLLGADPRTDLMYLSRPGRQLSPTMVRLPRAEDMRRLVEVCRQRLSAYLPRVDYNEIDSQAVQPVSSSNSGTGSVLTESKDFLLFSQLYITMSLGKVLLNQSSCQEVSHARSLYHQALSLVDPVPPIPAHWLGLAKLHFLRAVFLMQGDDLQTAVQAISSSIQFAWQSRLNDQNSWISCSSGEVRSRRTLWWAIYCFDRRLSQKVGKPYNISDKEVAVDDPISREQMTLCQELEVCPDNIRQEELYLQLLVDLSRLWGKIWDKFFRAGSKASNDDQEVELMGLRISHLHRSVPRVFRWSNSVLSNDARNAEPNLQTTQRLVIHTSPLRTEPVSVEQARFCHVLASELVEILAAVIDHYTLPRIQPVSYFLTSTLIECSYHLARILRNPLCDTERPAATITFGKLVEMLRMLAPTVKTAQRAIAILQSYTTSTAEDSFVSTIQSSGFPRLHGYENDFVSMAEYWPSISPSSSDFAQNLAGYYPNAVDMTGVSPGVEGVLNPADFGIQMPADGMATGTVEMEDSSFPPFYMPYIG